MQNYMSIIISLFIIIYLTGVSLFAKFYLSKQRELKMINTYNKDYALALQAVDEAYEAYKAALENLHADYHSLNESVVDTVDLTAVNYQICDLKDWRTDNLIDLIKDHEELRFNDNYGYGRAS